MDHRRHAATRVASPESLPSDLRGSAFVGREREMAEVLASLEDVLARRGRLILISGEPGIGKSRLADEAAAKAGERGARVLWGRCWEGGGAPAYWPWVQSIRSYLREADPLSLRTQLGRDAPSIAQMLPEVGDLLPDVPAMASVDPETARFRLFDATTSFLKRAALDRPLLLVLDDLHMADTPSLLLLQFLAGDVRDARILAVATYRDTELTRGHPLVAAISELLRLPVTRRLALTGLTEADVARFIELTGGITPSPGLVAAVHAETEGNPLFVGELVQLLAAEGKLEGPGDGPWTLTVPRGVREVIARRLSTLSEGCNRVLAMASVLGREFHLEVLERASGIAKDALRELLEEADAAGVVTDVPGALGRLRFSHALIRDALYDELSAAQRVRLHRRVGEALEDLYGADPDPHLAELAHHFVQAAPGGDPDRAIEYARRAGELAVRSLAYEEAVRLLGMARQALDLKAPADEAVRCDLLLALGDAQARAGDEPMAKESFLRAARIAERLRLPEQLARAALGYGGRFVWARAGTDRRLVPLLEKALAALGKGDSTVRVRLTARLAGALRDQLSREPRTSLSEEALEMARRMDDPATLTYALDGRCAVLLWPENPEERIALATELVGLAERVGDREKVVQGRYYRLMALLELGDLRAVKADLETIDRLATDLRQRPQLWLATVTRATLALLEGRFEEAERLIPEVLALGETAQRRDALLSFRIQQFTLRRHRGGLEDLEPIIRQWAAEYPERPMFRCLLALLFAETGHPSEARRLFEELAADDYGSLPLSNEWIFSMSFLAEAAEILGDAARARTMYALLLPYASYTGATADYICTGAVSRSLGLLAAVMERWDEATRHFDDALRRNEAMGARPWVAHTRYDHARMLLARDLAGDRERAAELLGEALDLCRELGMAPLEERVIALLEEPGGAAPDTPMGRQARAPSQAGAPLEVSVFRQEGEYWSIAYGGEAFRLRDTKGLRYIARLLAAPTREIHVLDLVGGESGSVGRGAGGLPERGGRGDAGEVLDPKARAAYRQRLVELEAEAEEAAAFGDAERAARAREETDFLARELAGAVGLGGRGRVAGSASERARVAVTKAIRAALARIGRHNPALGRHLEATIRTGTFCAYVADPHAPISWRF